MDRVPMTKEGYEKILAELQQLKTIERKKVVEEIATARAHGDLRENAEYHAAKEKQSFMEGRILELEDKIARAQVIDISNLSTDKVIFGVKVTVQDLDTDEQRTYRIVGTEEADLAAGKISFSAPLARALLGKTKGDDITFNAPGGTREYTILSISR